jgi:hypothetical protein
MPVHVGDRTESADVSKYAKLESNVLLTINMYAGAVVVACSRYIAPLITELASKVLFAIII